MQNVHVVSRAVLQAAGPAYAVHIPSVVEEANPESKSFHFGSQDLIRLAGFAQENGFKVSRFSLADSYLTPLEADEERRVSRSMVEILGHFDARELRGAMLDEFDGLYVIGVELISKESGHRLTVRRSGFIDTSAVVEAERLLTSAWQVLTFR
ncbi:hypothetical protein QP157_08655 [Sphingomonas sp. LR61]|uniref:hypothetical protein n=1 Tax=Sphingomonas sp. LR61 TaxID=3050234 RepID=UPI002FDFC603